MAVKLELDHIFILVAPEAKVADQLVSLGLIESFSREHHGQGTSNRRFEFSNGMLEFLWVRDAEEANNGPAKDLLLPERANNPSASPFGIILNRKENTAQLPFDGWKYQPDYFPAHLAFHIGNNSSKIVEPLCIYVPFMEPMNRDIGEEKFTTISNVKIHTTEASFSEILMAVNHSDRLIIEHCDEHLVELVLDNHRLGMSKDFRPDIPLLLYW